MILDKTLMGSETLTWAVNTRDQIQPAASKVAERKELCSICGFEVTAGVFWFWHPAASAAEQVRLLKDEQETKSCRQGSVEEFGGSAC